MEYTLVIIKPDGFEKNIYKDVMDRFLKNNLSIYTVSILKLNSEILREHYHHLVERTFYSEMEKFMMSNYVIVMTVGGVDAVKKVRLLVGATDPKKADIGTIRRDYGTSVSANVVHASDSVTNAEIELNRFSEYQKKLIKNK